MQEVAIFDLDNTLIKEQSQAALLSYARKKGLISLPFYFKTIFWFILYKLGLVKNPKKIMEYAFGFLRGKKEEDFRNIVKDFFERDLRKYIYKEAINVVNEQIANGKKIIIISNALQYIVEAVAIFLKADYSIGTKLEVSGGEFTGKIKGDIIYAENKVLVLNSFLQERGLFLKGSWGYSDHHSDMPLLEVVEFPVAVNPTKKLLIEANKHKWPVLFFKHTIY